MLPEVLSCPFDDRSLIKISLTVLLRFHKFALKQFEAAKDTSPHWPPTTTYRVLAKSQAVDTFHPQVTNFGNRIKRKVPTKGQVFSSVRPVCCDSFLCPGELADTCDNASANKVPSDTCVPVAG